MLAKHPERNEIVPYPQYPSGVTPGTSGIYTQGYASIQNPVLALKEDIVDKNGRGLLAGFYEVRSSDLFEFLLFYQNGVLKAKIPVIKTETINTEIVKVKKKKKKKKTYYDDKKDEEFIHLDVKINKIDEYSYEIIWEKARARAYAIIKI